MRELETLRRRADELSRYAGSFALVHADQVDVFASWDEAVRAGYRRFGLEPFLGTPITTGEEARFVARMTIARHLPAQPGACRT